MWKEFFILMTSRTFCLRLLLWKWVNYHLERAQRGAAQLSIPSSWSESQERAAFGLLQEEQTTCSVPIPEGFFFLCVLLEWWVIWILLHVLTQKEKVLMKTSRCLQGGKFLPYGINYVVFCVLLFQLRHTWTPPARASVSMEAALCLIQFLE